ncbi:hypothetical protein, partial [Geobacillus sp. WSUCF-018B]|uniref:hypothetical protein n=1 Tax=Geobacillus sp. WSUCF-018B TaxID=2055939 RepID=UPI0011AFAD57
EFFPLPRAFSMTEMPYLCWAFLYTSTGVNSYEKIITLIIMIPSFCNDKDDKMPMICAARRE